MQQCRIAGAVLVAFVVCGFAWSQEKPAARSQSGKETQTEKLSGRLPNNYAKLGISDAQRQKIYGIQAKYSDQIDALIKQVEDLRSKRDTEVESVLTAEQKEKLKSLQKETAGKKAAKGDADK